MALLKDQYLKSVLILSSKAKKIHQLLKGSQRLIKKKKKMRCHPPNIGSKKKT